MNRKKPISWRGPYLTTPQVKNNCAETATFAEVVMRAVVAFKDEIRRCYPEISTNDEFPRRNELLGETAKDYLRHWLYANTPKVHTTDADCARYIDKSTHICAMCWTYHADPCRTCGGKGFHNPGCQVSVSQQENPR